LFFQVGDPLTAYAATIVDRGDHIYIQTVAQTTAFLCSLPHTGSGFRSP
jgi:hypothetical protein